MACSVCKETSHRKPKCPNKQKVWEERHIQFRDEYERLLVEAVLTPLPPMPTDFTAGQNIWAALHTPCVFTILREKSEFSNIDLSPLEAALIRYWSLGKAPAKHPGAWSQVTDDESKSFIALRNQMWDTVVSLAGALQLELSSA